MRLACSGRDAYSFVRLVILIPVFAQIVVLLVILVLEIALLEVVVERLELESLAREPVNGTGDKLLLDVLAELVVELQALLDIGCRIVVVLGWWLWWREEVEERFGWNGLLYDPGLLCVWVLEVSSNDGAKRFSRTYSCYAASYSQS